MASATDWSDGHFVPLPDGEVTLLQKQIHVAVRRYRRSRGLLVRRPFNGGTYIADHMRTASNLANEEFTPVCIKNCEVSL